MLIIFFLPQGFRRFLLFLGGLFLLSLLAGALSPSGLLSSPPGPVVVIDPGHGGVDGGTGAPGGTLEKEINLAIALRIRDHLGACGVNVVMTRTTDTDLSPYRPGRAAGTGGIWPPGSKSQESRGCLPRQYPLRLGGR